MLRWLCQPLVNKEDTDYDGHSNVCGGLGGVVGPLELVAVLGGAAAAIAGGIGTAATSQARWIAGGLAATLVCVVLLSFVVGVQQPAVN